MKRLPARVTAERDIEWLAVVFHVGTRAFQHRECGVTFIEMADLGLQSQGSQEPPASNRRGLTPVSNATPDHLRTVPS